jgi:hypothetical protein
MLTYPCKVMRITQSYTGSTSHKPHWYGAKDYKDYPIDEGCTDGGRDWFYCPCDEIQIVKIYGVGNRGTNTVWMESTSEVDTACGEHTFVTILVTHPNDDDLRKLRIGQTFRRGQPMFREGTDGATGNHFHISVGKGHMISGGWDLNSNGRWVLRTSISCYYPQCAFYVDTSFTKIVDKSSLSFKIISQVNERSHINTSNSTFSNGAEKFNPAYRNGKVFTVKPIVGLRLRKSPKNGEMIKVLKCGSKVTCYGFYTPINGENWYYVSDGACEGFVSAAYLKI